MLVFGLLWLPSDQLRWLGSSCQMKKPCRKRLSSQKVRGSRLPVNLSAEWSTWHKNDPQRIDAKEICVVWNSPPPPPKKKSVQRFQIVLELPRWVFRCQKMYSCPLKRRPPQTWSWQNPTSVHRISGGFGKGFGTKNPKQTEFFSFAYHPIHAVKNSKGMEGVTQLYL